MSLFLNFLKDLRTRPHQTSESGLIDSPSAANSGNPAWGTIISAEEQIRMVEALSSQLEGINHDLRRNSGYLARQEMRTLLAEIRVHPKRLEQYGFKVYSQNDEDGILAEIFRRIGIIKGTFCEIGVENGLECNTLFLIHHGWRGVWFEGNENQKNPIEAKFHSLLANGRLSLAVGFIQPQNVNAALVDAASRLGVATNDLDFLSIDIDGMDIYVLEALEHLPKVICIEYNAKFPPPLAKKPTFNAHSGWNGTDYMGSSLAAINEVANAKGYSLVGTNLVGLNAFFVRNDLLGNLFDDNLTPENLYNPPRYYLTLDHFHYDVGHKADFGPYTDLE